MHERDVGDDQGCLLLALAGFDLVAELRAVRVRVQNGDRLHNTGPLREQRVRAQSAAAVGGFEAAVHSRSMRKQSAGRVSVPGLRCVNLRGGLSDSQVSGDGRPGTPSSGDM
ncbi:hypothetical protein GCM10010360_75420 [Streptomyces nogalater]